MNGSCGPDVNRRTGNRLARQQSIELQCVKERQDECEEALTCLPIVIVSYKQRNNKTSRFKRQPNFELHDLRSQRSMEGCEFSFSESEQQGESPMANRRRTWSSGSQTVSLRNERLMKILLCFLILFVLSNAPLLYMDILSLMTDTAGSQCLLRSTRVIAWRVSCLLMAINASVNCPLYYNLSSKYKVTFHSLFSI